MKRVAKNVMAHRILLTYEAEAEELTQRAVIQQVLDGVQVP